MVNRNFNDRTISDNSQIDIGSEERIDVFGRKPEEVKQEQSPSEAEREGHMNFLGESGCSQSIIAPPPKTLTQPVLKKRAEREINLNDLLSDDGDDLNSVIASLTNYKRKNK